MRPHFRGQPCSFFLFSYPRRRPSEGRPRDNASPESLATPPRFPWHRPYRDYVIVQPPPLWTDASSTLLQDLFARNHPCGEDHEGRHELVGCILLERPQVPVTASHSYEWMNSGAEPGPITRETRAPDWIKREARVPGQPPERDTRIPNHHVRPPRRRPPDRLLPRRDRAWRTGVPPPIQYRSIAPNGLTRLHRRHVMQRAQVLRGRIPIHFPRTLRIHLASHAKPGNFEGLPPELRGRAGLRRYPESPPGHATWCALTIDSFVNKHGIPHLDIRAVKQTIEHQQAPQLAAGHLLQSGHLRQRAEVPPLGKLPR